MNYLKYRIKSLISLFILLPYLISFKHNEIFCDQKSNELHVGPSNVELALP